PGDGIDQDCDGVDGWTEEPADPEPAPGASDVLAMAELRARAHAKNVLVVLVDALRFDRLEDPLAATSPRLAGLSRRSVSFARALSPAARTPLSVPALLDGRRGGPGNTLFHAFHAAGARAGFVSIDVVLDQLHLADTLGGEVDLVGIPTEGERSVWGGGVHVFTGAAVTDAALRWVDAGPAAPAAGQRAPWLLWVHYFDAHQWDAIDGLRSIPGMPRRYDAALAEDDRAVGALLDGLEARGLGQSTVVVLLADHGESLGDHGLRTHGFYLYPELVHVPMSVLVPGVPPRSIPTVVPTAAMTPTLLDLMQIAARQDGAEASLVPLMAGATPPDGVAPRPVVMQDTLQSALALGPRLLRFTPGENATELSPLDDLDAMDPGDLVAREPDTAARMSRALVSHLAP
ncbi:MAG TPA: sulfatase-like hydrolase/transferase, partial [Polyangiaceae bacterium]